MMIQLSLGLAAGLHPRPAAAGPGAPAQSAVLTELIRDQAIFDSGAHRGLSVASVPLAGTTDAPDGAVIEVRAVSLQDGGAATTPWAALGTAAGGTFAGVFQAPRVPSWYRAEVRVQGSTAAAQMANRFAAGHVWAIWDQSLSAKLVTDMPSNPAQMYEPIALEGDVQIIHRNKGTATANVTSITEATKGSSPVTPQMVKFANAFSALAPGHKLALAFQTETNTSIMDTLSTIAEDPAGARDWNDDRAVHLKATDVGTQVGIAFCPGWFASVVGYGTNAIGNYLKTFTGHDAAGAKVDIDTIWGGINLRRIPVAVMADGSTTDSKGEALGGVYDMRYTKACYFGPAGGGMDQTWLLGASTYATIGAMPTYDTTPQFSIWSNAVQIAEAVWNTANGYSDVINVPGTPFGAYRSAQDVNHYEVSDENGAKAWAAMYAFLMTRAAGLHSFSQPQLNGRYDDPAGAFADFWITGRNLTTLRKIWQADGRLAALGLPSTIPAIAPHRTEVMGWSINTHPAAQAVLMTASSHPVLPNGQVYCRVYPNSGVFSYADVITYGLGGVPGFLADEDYGDRVDLDWLRCDVGQPHAVQVAMPVRLQQLQPLPSTLTAPDLYKVAGTTHMRSTANAIPPGTTAYMEAMFRPDVLPVGGIELMGLGDDAYVRVGQDGSVQLFDLQASAVAPAGTIAQGQFRTLGFIANRTAGSQKLQIIDVANGGSVLATSTVNQTGPFHSGRINFFYRGGVSGGQFNGTVGYARIWLNKAGPTGNPNYAVEAIPAAPHYTVPYSALQLTSANPTPPVDGTL